MVSVVGKNDDSSFGRMHQLNVRSLLRGGDPSIPQEYPEEFGTLHVRKELKYDTKVNNNLLL
jgi:hypothetical protein